MAREQSVGNEKWKAGDYVKAAIGSGCGIVCGAFLPIVPMIVACVKGYKARGATSAEMLDSALAPSKAIENGFMAGSLAAAPWIPTFLAVGGFFGMKSIGEKITERRQIHDEESKTSFKL